MSNPQETSKTMSIVKKILNVLLWVLLAFALVIMIFTFVSVSNDYGVPMFGNKVFLNVQSDSMSPTFNKGDMLVGTVLTEEEKQTLQVGDIITFYVDLDGDGAKELNTHRIVSITADHESFYTQGDNKETNKTLDDYTISARDIVATWHAPDENGKGGDTRIVGLGSFMSFMQSSTGFLLLIVLPLLAFFIYELIQFILLIIKIKNGDKKKMSPEEEALREKLYEEYLLKQKAAEDAAKAAEENSAAGQTMPEQAADEALEATPDTAEAPVSDDKNE